MFSRGKIYIIDRYLKKSCAIWKKCYSLIFMYDPNMILNSDLPDPKNGSAPQPW